MDYRFGPFRLDTAKRRLWRGDELVPLTPKAFDTLLVLVARAGKVVEKDEILKVVWADTFVEEATLAQNISTLRRILGDTPETPRYLATVPRRGYRFLEPVTEVLDAQAKSSAIEMPDAIAIASTTNGAVVASDSPGAAGSRPLPLAAPRKVRGLLVVALSATGILGLIAMGIRGTPITSPLPMPVVFGIWPPDGGRFSTSGGLMAVSPDGRHVAFVAASPDGIDRLWLRSLDSSREHTLAGTEGASQPFWSSDSRFVAFFAEGKLKKVGIAAGMTQTICSAPTGSQPLTGTWNSHDDILFSSVRQGIFRVAATGGTAVPLITKTPEDDSVLWPQFLPDERHFLYVVGSMRPDRAGIYVGTLDSTERTRVVPTRSYALYAPSGHLLFMQDGTLVAQRFDAMNRKLTGDSIPVADSVGFNLATGRGTFSVSQNGVLAYRSVPDTQLVWFDRTGKSLGPIGSVAGYLQFSLSPDNTRVAAARLDPQTGTPDIWIFDARGGDERRLTFDASRETWPLWSPDGSSIAFNSDRRGRWEVYKKASSGNGAEQRLLSSDTSVFPDDWSREGRMLFHQRDRKAKGNLSLLAADGTAKPSRLPDLESDESAGRISPDGRWLAYIGWESGWSVYVRPLHSTESRWQLSPPGNIEAEPRWRADGRELFFLSSDLSMMAVNIEPGPAFRAGPPRRLFQTQAVAPTGLTGQMAYDVTSDGQRFLIKVPASSPPITVIVNWTSLFQDRH